MTGSLAVLPAGRHVGSPSSTRAAHRDASRLLAAASIAERSQSERRAYAVTLADRRASGRPDADVGFSGGKKSQREPSLNAVIWTL